MSVCQTHEWVCLYEEDEGINKCQEGYTAREIMPTSGGQDGDAEGVFKSYFLNFCIV